MSHISASLQAVGVGSEAPPDLGSFWQSVQFSDHSAPIFITGVGPESLLWPCELTTCPPGMNNWLMAPHFTHCPWRMTLTPTTFPDPCGSPCLGDGRDRAMISPSREGGGSILIEQAPHLYDYECRQAVLGTNKLG